MLGAMVVRRRAKPCLAYRLHLDPTARRQMASWHWQTPVDEALHLQGEQSGSLPETPPRIPSLRCCCRLHRLRPLKRHLCQLDGRKH